MTMAVMAAISATTITVRVAVIAMAVSMAAFAQDIMWCVVRCVAGSIMTLGVAASSVVSVATVSLPMMMFVSDRDLEGNSCVGVSNSEGQEHSRKNNELLHSCLSSLLAIVFHR